MLHIGLVDTYYQGLGGLRGLDSLSVRRIKPLGLEFSADSQRVTANRHVACTHIAETADLKDPGRRAIRHPSPKFGEQIAYLWRCPPRHDFTQREALAVPVRMLAAAAGPIPASPKSKGAENCLNALGADVLNALGLSTMHARPAAEGIGVRLAANDLDLDSAQQLLTFLECQPDLLRRQVGDPPGNRANVVRDWRVAIGRELKADRPFQQRDSERRPVNWVGATQEEAIVSRASSASPRNEPPTSRRRLRLDIRRGSPLAVLADAKFHSLYSLPVRCDSSLMGGTPPEACPPERPG